MNVASTDRKAKHRFKPRSGTGCHRTVRTPAGWISRRLMLPTATAFYGALLAHLRQRRTRSGTTTSPSANAPAPVQRSSPSMPSDPTRHQDRHQPNARMCLGADKSLRIWKVYRRICHPAADGPTVEEPAPSAQSV